MDNTVPNNNDGQNNSQNNSDSTSNDNALIITENNLNHEEPNELTEVRNTMMAAGGSSLESEEATSTSEAVTSPSSTEVESLAASLIRAQEEHRRAEAERATQAQEVRKLTKIFCSDNTGLPLVHEMSYFQDESCIEEADKNIYHVKWIK